MKKFLKFLIALLVGTVIFSIVMNKAGWERLSESFVFFFQPAGLIVILITLIISLIGILKWQMIIKSQGEKVSLLELAKIWIAGFSVDYLTPIALLGGEAFRVYFAKRKLNLSWRKSTASVLIDKILDGTFFLAFLIIGTLCFLWYGVFPSRLIAVLAALIIVFLTGVFLIFYYRTTNKESFLEWVLWLLGINKEEVQSTQNGKMIFSIEEEIIRFFSPKRKEFWQGFVLSFLRHVFLIIRASFIIFILVQVFELPKVLSIYGLSIFSLVLPLPAGIGGMEALLSMGFSSLGFGFSKGVMFSMIWRMGDLIICFVGVLLLLKYFVESFKDKFFSFFNRFSQ